MSSARAYFRTVLSYYRQRPLLTAAAGGTAFAGSYYLGTNFLRWRTEQVQLNLKSFTPYTLVAKHRVSDTSSVFVLRPPGNALKAAPVLAAAWDADVLWSVQAKQPQLQLGREYTPLPPVRATRSSAGDGGSGDEGGRDGADAADLHLLIRKEMNGEMTTYLYALPLSATVHLRGPYPDVKVPDNCDEIIFIAGGTGISAALQTAHILARQGRGAKMHILWANRWRVECIGGGEADKSVVHSGGGYFGTLKSMWDRRVKPAVKETVEAKAGDAEKGIVVRIIDEMKASVPEGALQVRYFVDEEDTFVRGTDVKNILAASKRSDVDGAPPAIKLIMVSGPEGFIDYWAGRKRIKGEKESQGPLGGILGEMDLKGWKVWKL